MQEEARPWPCARLKRCGNAMRKVIRDELGKKPKMSIFTRLRESRGKAGAARLLRRRSAHRAGIRPSLFLAAAVHLYPCILLAARFRKLPRNATWRGFAFGYGYFRRSAIRWSPMR